MPSANETDLDRTILPESPMPAVDGKYLDGVMARRAAALGAGGRTPTPPESMNARELLEVDVPHLVEEIRRLKAAASPRPLRGLR